MKKFAMFLICFVCLFSCGGCENKIGSKQILNNMAEITSVYYFGENEDFYCVVECGEREEPYILNGVREKVVPFALLTISFFGGNDNDVLSVNLLVDEKQILVECEKNQMNGDFVCDTELELSGNEKICVSFENYSIELVAVSNDFVCDKNQIIDIVCKNFQEELSTFFECGCECYLKVLNGKKNGFDDFFWCFSCVNTKNKNFSAVISTTTGEIVAKKV